MPCYHPLSGLRRADGTIRFPKHGIFAGIYDEASSVTVGCGRCIGCRLDSSRDWAVRIMHESQSHSANCFITLTYNKEHLPNDGSLQLRDWQLFAKRLRKQEGPFRYFHCGEYGDRHGRPHYHAVLFGVDFRSDRTLYDAYGQHPLYTSDRLDSAWSDNAGPIGLAIIGELTFDSAAYVARYVTKKITGSRAFEHYAGRKPEYTTMSRRPGIASAWYKQFKHDVFPRDEVIFKGFPTSPPRYYSRLLEIENPALLEQIKERRVKQATKYIQHTTRQRLATRESIATKQLNQYQRNKTEKPKCSSLKKSFHSETQKLKASTCHSSNQPLLLGLGSSNVCRKTPTA